MTPRFWLSEPRTSLAGVVITRHQREVTRTEYEEAARRHGWQGTDIVAEEFAWEDRHGTYGWVEE